MLQRLLVGRYGSGQTDLDDIRIDAVTNTIQTISYEHHEIHDGCAFYTEGHVTLEDQDVPINGNFYARFITPDTAKWGHFVWIVTSSGILNVSMYEGSVGGMADGKRGVIHNQNRNSNCWMGWQDGGDNESLLTDGSQAWTVDALIGMQVFNQTDGSSGFITDNDGDTVTATLAGGTDNDWDDGDVYEINNSQMVITTGMAVPTTLGLLIADTAFGGTGFKEDVGGGTERSLEIIARQNETYVMHIKSGSDANVITYHLHWYEHQNKH